MPALPPRLPPPLRVRLGAVVRRRRAAAGYSQEAFADRVGVHRTFMSTVERGLSNVSLETLERIAAGLGARAGDLLLEAERSEEDRRTPHGPAADTVSSAASENAGGTAGNQETDRLTGGAPEPPVRDAR